MRTETGITEPRRSGVAQVTASRLQAWQVEIVSVLVLVAATVSTSLYTAWRMFVYDSFDYHFHVDLALEMKDSLSIEAPHFLYHAYFILLKVLLPGLGNQALATLTIASLRAAAAVVIFCLLRGALGRSLTYRAGLMIAGTSFALMIVTPITVRTWAEGRMYLGYIGMNAFHNPTIIMLVPLAVPLAWIAARIVTSTPDRPGLKRDAWLAALLITLSTLAKPSYLICLLPAVGLMALWRLVRGERLPWPALIFGIGIPGVILLVWQYIFTYGGGGSGESLAEAGIMWAPLEVMSTHASSSLIDKFVLSIAFPALVYVLFLREALRDRFFTLSAIATVIGTCFAYLLAESGQRLQDGNFVWSAQITLFIWFVAAVRFLIRHNAPTLFGQDWLTRLRSLAVLAVLGLHLVSGVIFQARGAMFRTGWDFPPGVPFDYTSPTLENTLSGPVLDAYRHYRENLIYEALTLDRADWGLLWVPEQAEPDRYDLIGAMGERIEAVPPPPLDTRARYFDLIDLLYRRRYFDLSTATPDQRTAFERWLATALPADLRAAGVRYVLASDAWLQARPAAQQQRLLDPQQYTRLPVKDDLTLFAAAER